MPKRSKSSHHSQKSALTDTFKSQSSTEQTSIPSPPLESDNVDIIGYESVIIDTNDDIHSVATTALDRALRSANYGGAGEMITYGNQAGRSLLEERHEMKEMMKRLEAKMANNETQIADLQSRVKALAQSSEGYRKIRNRFLDVYRRDVLGDIDKQGFKNISEGNIAAHEGDAVADAELFTSGKRSDDDVLIDLYGLSSSRISDLARVDNFNCISILNIRATWKTKGQIIPPDVAAAFEIFVKELDMNPDQDVTNSTTPLSKAYYTLTAHHKKR